MRKAILPLLALAFMVTGVATTTRADSPAPIDGARAWRRPPPVAPVAQMDLVADDDRGLPTFALGSRRFVMGSLGERYKIRITNPTAARVEAVVSVDGLDAIDGKPADVSKRGYLIPAFGTVTIDGWRTSLDRIAAFRFSSVPDSYADRTDHDRNIGVIGVALFRENVPVVIAPKRPSSWHANRAAGAAAEAPPPTAGMSPKAEAPSERSGLGTRFGEEHSSHVTQTAFVRESSVPASVAEVRYNDREGLRAMGVAIPTPENPAVREARMRETAQAFPRTFAAPPP